MNEMGWVGFAPGDPIAGLISPTTQRPHKIWRMSIEYFTVDPFAADDQHELADSFRQHRHYPLHQPNHVSSAKESDCPKNEAIEHRNE